MPRTPNEKNEGYRVVGTYCPACGEWNRAQEVIGVSPGDYNWTCPDCDTEFTIRIGYEEVEKEGE